MKFVSSTLERKKWDQPCPWREHLLHCSAGIPQHQPWREISKGVKTPHWYLPSSRPWSTMIRLIIRHWPTHPVVASSEMQRGAVSTWEFNSISIIKWPEQTRFCWKPPFSTEKWRQRVIFSDKNLKIKIGFSRLLINQSRFLSTGIKWVSAKILMGMES